MSGLSLKQSNAKPKKKDLVTVSVDMVIHLGTGLEYWSVTVQQRKNKEGVHMALMMEVNEKSVLERIACIAFGVLAAGGCVHLYTGFRDEEIIHKLGEFIDLREVEVS